MNTTSHILMIRPVNFSFNEQTAVNNAFQVSGAKENVQSLAEKEFDDMVSLLKAHDIDIIVINDTPEPFTPDSIFPNNWISFHAGGTVCLYPMFAENRRLERKPNVIQSLANQFRINNTIDLSVYEQENNYLEGTGSMVLDRVNKIAYACLSPRTDKKLLETFCEKMQYEPVSFYAYDALGGLIYHTNVMMCVADKFVVICLDSIRDEKERKAVSNKIESSGKRLIEITVDQMNHFAGNMLQVQNNRGDLFLVMSSQAYYTLTEKQLTELTSFNKILHANLKTIEANGGGSARCMMAEIFLDKL